jgi:thymidylate synthase
MDYDNDWRSGYLSIVRRVSSYPDSFIGSRAGDVREIDDFVFTLTPEAMDLPLGVGRKINTNLAAAEAIQLCAGVGLPTLTEAVAKNVADYVRDPDGTVHGNYGGRVSAQIADVVEKLDADPSSRQAIIQIWDKYVDSPYRQPMPKDIPCTLTLTFRIRDERLLLSVVMRSSDVWLGLPFDVFQFRQLQRTIAHILGYDIGEYCHHSVSMHLYEKDLERARSLTFDEQWKLADPLPEGLFSPTTPALPGTAFSVLDGMNLKSRSHQWYHARLGEAWQKMKETQ